MSSIKYNTAHVLLEKVAANWIEAVRDTLEDDGGNPADLLLNTGIWSYALEQWAKNHDGGIDGAKLDLAHGLMFGYDAVDDNGRLEQKYVVSAPLPNREYLRLYLCADGTVMPLTTQAGEKYAPIVGGDHVLTHDEVAQLSNANMIARAFVITPVYFDVTSEKFHDDEPPFTLSPNQAAGVIEGELFYVFTRRPILETYENGFNYYQEYLYKNGHPLYLYSQVMQHYAPNVNGLGYFIYTRKQAEEMEQQANNKGYTVHAIYATKGHWEDV